MKKLTEIEKQLNATDDYYALQKDEIEYLKKELEIVREENTNLHLSIKEKDSIISGLKGEIVRLKMNEYREKSLICGAEI